MNDTEKSIEFLRIIGDRAVQRGGIFNTVNESVNYANAVGHLMIVIRKYEEGGDPYIGQKIPSPLPNLHAPPENNPNGHTKESHKEGDH